MSLVEKHWGQIRQLFCEPEDNPDEHKCWLWHEDTISYLVSTCSGIIPIYVSGHNFFMYSVLVPEAALSGNYVDDLLSWNFMVSRGWGYGYFFENGKPQKIISAPMGEANSNTLRDRTPLIYLREFFGYPPGKETYIELDQRIAHILDIHWVDSYNAYCNLNRLGDIQPVVEVSNTEQGFLVLADLRELDFYMYLTDSVLVRVFDVMKYKGGRWDEENRREKIFHIKETPVEIHAKLVLVNREQSYLRGFQIIRRQSPDEVMEKILQGEEPFPKQYATFIALDWKHREVRECSCSPDALASYFEESDLPFQTTPAFFRPEVLLKYKQNPDKYAVKERQITCRGTWTLRYDINSEGQVHVYLCDLQLLPYEEQLYWKSFNEPPKSGISSRAYKTDFLAEWDMEYDPLRSLKQALDEFPLAKQYGQKRAIWRKPSSKTNSFSRLSYVVTDSRKEWEDQVLELARIIIDNFDKRNIRKVAKLLGCDDAKLGSLKLLRRCLLCLNVDQEVVEEMMEPLETLWQLRSTGIAHFGDSVPKDIDLRQHHKSLVASLDNAMRLLSDLVKSGMFDISSDGKLIERA